MSDATPPQSHRSEAVSLAVLANDVRALTKAMDRLADLSEDHSRLLGEIQTSLAVGEKTMEALATKDGEIDRHLVSTDSAITAMQADRRSTAALWTSLGGIATAVGSFFYALWNHKP